MTTITSYRLHDLLIHSEVPLAALTADAGVTYDPESLTIRHASPTVVPSSVPEGELLALVDDEGDRFAVTQNSSEYILRFCGLCEFRLNLWARTLNVHPNHGTDPELVPLLLTSTVLSLVLGLMGQCVIHASAVVHRDQAVAFIGPSAVGKSSLAAALCARGWPLLTDDALRCESGSAPRCSRGTFELRLREVAADLADLFDPVCARTADNRISVRATPAPLPHYRLSLVLAPSDGPVLRAERLSGVSALQTMLKAARVTSWHTHALVAQQLEQLAALARSVPIYALSVPSRLVHDEAGRGALHNLVLRLLEEPAS